VLFKGAKDLLEEFKLFLPDPNGGPAMGALASSQTQMAIDVTGHIPVPMDEDGSGANRKKVELSTATKRKRRQVDKEIANAARIPPTKVSCRYPQAYFHSDGA
jgi:hypothetical protein